MRQRFCTSCGERIDEASKAWDQMAATGRCASCGAACILGDSQIGGSSSAVVRTASPQPEDLSSSQVGVPSRAAPPRPDLKPYSQLPERRTVSDRALIGAYAGALLMPIVGCVMAIYLLAKERLGHAFLVGAISLFMMTFWWGFWGGVEDHTSVQAYVQCSGNIGGLECAITRTAGNVQSEICWDVTMACRNGARPVGHGCAAVPPGVGSASTHIIPWDLVSNLNRCDQVVESSVANLAFRRTAS
jgi:hypothetical protein